MDRELEQESSCGALKFTKSTRVRGAGPETGFEEINGIDGDLPEADFSTILGRITWLPAASNNSAIKYCLRPPTTREWPCKPMHHRAQCRFHNS